MGDKNEWKPALLRFVKESLRNRPLLRLALIVLAGLWIVTGTKLVTERILYRERNLREAVAMVRPGSTAGKMLFAAKLQENYLTEDDMPIFAWALIRKEKQAFGWKGKKKFSL